MNRLLTTTFGESTAGVSCGLGVEGAEGALTARLGDFSDASRASMSSSVLVVVASADASSSAWAALCMRIMESLRR